MGGMGSLESEPVVPEKSNYLERLTGSAVLVH